MDKQDYLCRGLDIVKSYGEGARVLEHVDLSVGAGEFVSIMGPSGSGKSTLLYILSGVEQADEGKVYFDGRDLSACKEKELADLRRQEMGFVFQHPAMLKNLSILDNIILPSMAGGKVQAAELTEKAGMLMRRTGIDGLGERGITQVSGGQLQRAGICRALMGKPKMIFADEPTGALNSRSAVEIMDIFTEIHESGTAVLLVTHDARIAARTERVLFMRDGNIVEEMDLGKKGKDSWEKRAQRVMAKMQVIGI